MEKWRGGWMVEGEGEGMGAKVERWRGGEVDAGEMEMWKVEE